MKRVIIFLALLSLVGNSVLAQDSHNPIVFAMPILTVVPDARASGMGDIGVATLPTANDQHWNASKYVFNEARSGVSLSYIPWLRGIGTSNINLLYLTGFYRLDNKQAIGASIRYFSLGAMTFWGEQQEYIKSSNPNEMAIDVSYSRLLGEYFSAGVAFRYLRSDITGGSYDNGTVFKPANAWSADIGFYFNKPIRMGAMTGVVSAGLSITNIGSKMNYGYKANVEEDKNYFLPTTGRLGGNLKLDLDYYNELSFGVELSKYLVPTPPNRDGSGNVISGKDNDVSVPKGIIQSFYDAPGGFKEELQEIIVGLGAEYTYSRVFTVRGGYYYDYKWPQHKYATLGAGLIYYMFSFDVSYLIPVAKGLQSPLANTLHLTLSIDFGKSMTRRTFANN